MFGTRMIGTSGLVAAALVGLVAFAGCGGDKSNPVDSSTGGSGSGTGGAGGATSSGGATASGGAEAQGGAGPGFLCSYTPAPSEAITDFSVWSDGSWGDSTCCLTGGTFTYQTEGDAGLTLAVESEVLNVTGSIPAGNYAGFGFWFGPCTDASAYSGITFNLGGDSGASQVIFQVQTSRNYPIGDDKGECEGSWGSPCASNEFEIVMPVAGNVVNVAWADLTGGAPEAMDPRELMGIQWEFDCGDDPCDIAITLDDVAFY